MDIIFKDAGLTFLAAVYPKGPCHFAIDHFGALLLPLFTQHTTPWHHRIFISDKIALEGI